MPNKIQRMSLQIVSKLVGWKPIPNMHMLQKHGRLAQGGCETVVVARAETTGSRKETQALQICSGQLSTTRA